MDPQIEQCEINELTLEHAKQITPPEFSGAFDWFVEHTGAHISYLPMGTHSPSSLEMKIVRQAGIFSPDYKNLPSRGTGFKKYVASVHSQGNTYYDDREVIERPDCTWLLDYKAHATPEGREHKTDFNGTLVNNMEDGVPVGVFVKSKKGSGYDVLGLAYVEEYNPIAGVFTLHGPVTPATENASSFISIKHDDLTNEERKALEAIDPDSTEEVVKFDKRIRRVRQQRFREALISAYDGRCAISGFDTPEVLQAAHIDPYRGAKSQLTSNGILLRADLHLLYDANLLSITPETHTIRLAKRKTLACYHQLEGKRLRMPDAASAQPNDELLFMHDKQFVSYWGVA